MTSFLCLIVVITTLGEAVGFLPRKPFIGISPMHSNNALFMGRKVKPSMSDRRKKRAKRTVSPNVGSVSSIETDLVKENKPEQPSPLPPPSAPVAEGIGTSESTKSKEVEEIGQKASSLLASQRRSVDCLSYIKKRVEESFPIDDAADSLLKQGYFVYDGFLSSGLANNDDDFGDGLLTEMFEEGIDMLSNDKLELDIGRLGEGEFTSLITGGDKYIDCPRLTEYVVCMTRHLPPLMNKLDTVLSNSASMGSIRMYDRKTKLGTVELLTKENVDEDSADRSFGVICEDNNDTRRLTTHLFLSSKSWGSACGGGIKMESGESIGAVRDRLVMLRSDSCSHRFDTWKGGDDKDLQQAGCVIIHFVKS